MRQLFRVLLHLDTAAAAAAEERKAFWYRRVTVRTSKADHSAVVVRQ